MRHYHQNYPLSVVARLLGVSVTGYFDWLDRKPSKRQREREQEQALKLVTAEHEATRESYSAVKLHQHLRNQGIASRCIACVVCVRSMAFAVNVNAINALKLRLIATIKSLFMTIILNNNLRWNAPIQLGLVTLLMCLRMKVGYMLQGLKTCIRKSWLAIACLLA